jgi:hypothetical protein
MFSKSVVLGAALCLAAIPAQAAVVVDQSTIIFATTGTNFVGSSVQSGNGLSRIQSQSITAGRTGRLTRVDVQAFQAGGTGDLVVSIAAGIAGQPGYATLGSFAVARANVPTSAGSFAGGLVSVDVSSLAFDVAPGTVFSIGLAAPPPETGINAFSWVFDEFTATGGSLQPINYAGGYNQFNFNNSATWTTTGADRGFRTWVDTVPEPGSWAMLIAGFGLTGAVMRRRRAAIA